MWVLILIIVLNLNGGTTIQKVEGFKSKSACLEAIKNLPDAGKAWGRDVLASSCIEVK